MNKVTPFLMFNDQLEEAMAFYTHTFPDSEIKNLSRVEPGGPLTSAEFTVCGQTFMAFNGGPHFKFTDGFSLFVECVDQAEVDDYWRAFIDAGGKPVQCGWITDPFGISWQIVPRRFMELMADKDTKKSQAVMAAMLKMEKLIVADLEAAYHSG